MPSEAAMPEVIREFKDNKTAVDDTKNASLFHPKMWSGSCLTYLAC